MNAQLRSNPNSLFAADSEATHEEWRRIVVEARVSGIQVHDARMVASMRVRGIANLLTLNARDFHRFSGISVLTTRSLGHLNLESTP